MIEPIIGFCIFITVVFILVKVANNSRSKQYKILIENLKDKIILFAEQVKSSTMTFGLKNRNYLFNRCDLYLTENAIVILGYSKDSLFKQLSLPIIITNSNTYSNDFPFAYVKKPNEISFDNNRVKIAFGEKGVLATDVVIKLLDLTETQTDAIKSFVQKNC